MSAEAFAFCSQQTAAVHEPQAGTAAAGVRWWVMVEYAGVWGSKFVRNSDLPENIRTHLARVMDEVEGCRVQLIRRELPPLANTPLTIYLADVNDRTPEMFRLSWPEVATLDQLDLIELCRDPAKRAPYRCDDTALFVCTNGQRDRCCAKFGLQLFRALAALEPTQVWQTTHIGGHRFAPTLVSLPDGYCYGHLDPKLSGEYLDLHRRGHTFPVECIRGRVCYDQPAQAAEVYLRQQLGHREVGGISWQESAPVEGGFNVGLTTPDGRRVNL
ncbi:MAG: sucrase ferredoxin, partial [Nannocystaceae bacterium]